MEQPKPEKPDLRWKKYYERTMGKPPRELLIEAVSYVQNKDRAVDLGSGAFNDLKYLLSIGFDHVTAVDIEPIAKEELKDLPEDRVDYVISSFEDFDFPKDTYDLVNAQYALPFNRREIFFPIIDKIYNSLQSGGIFTGQFFGIRDTWNDGRYDMTFLTKTEVREALEKFTVIKFEEKENDNQPVVGDAKHWHVFHVIASK